MKNIRKIIAIIVLASVMILALATCGSSGSSEPPETVDYTWFGYSFGIPYYYSDFSNAGEDLNTEKICEMENQATLRIITNECDLSQKEFSEEYLELFKSATEVDASSYTIEDTDIDGLPGKILSGKNENKDEIRAVTFLNEDYGSFIIVYLNEPNNSFVKDYSYADDFKVICSSINVLTPEKAFEKNGYNISFPDYYKFIPSDVGWDNVYYANIEGEAFMQISIGQGASEGSLDINDKMLDMNLTIDENVAEISREDEVTKGNTKIRQFSYNYPGTYASGTGALIYNADNNTMISMNVIQNEANASEDYIGDFNAMIESIELIAKNN